MRGFVAADEDMVYGDNIKVIQDKLQIRYKMSPIEYEQKINHVSIIVE